MSIVEKIADYNKRKSSLEAEALGLKTDFENYVQDKDIPLELRWQTFIEADNDFKNHSDWYFHATSDGLKYIKNNWFDAPEVYGRGKRIYWSEALEDYFYLGEIQPHGIASSQKNGDKLLREAMEEILAGNQGSFCIDW